MERTFVTSNLTLQKPS